MPETWPTLSPEAIAALAGRPYAEVAFEVIRPFVGGEIADDDARAPCAPPPMPTSATRRWRRSIQIGAER